MPGPAPALPGLRCDVSAPPRPPLSSRRPSRLHRRYRHRLRHRHRRRRSGGYTPASNPQAGPHCVAHPARRSRVRAAERQKGRGAQDEVDSRTALAGAPPPAGPFAGASPRGPSSWAWMARDGTPGPGGFGRRRQLPGRRPPPGARSTPSTGASQIVGFDPLRPERVRFRVAVTNLKAGERLVGIDFRPADRAPLRRGQHQPGVHHQPAQRLRRAHRGPLHAGAGRGGERGGLQPPGGPPAGGKQGGAEPAPQPGHRASTGNGRTRHLAYATQPPADANAGKQPGVTGAAYTNNVARATSTVLYDVDTTQDVLAMQNPPNDGTLRTVGPSCGRRRRRPARLRHRLPRRGQPPGRAAQPAPRRGRPGRRTGRFPARGRPAAAPLQR